MIKKLNCCNISLPENVIFRILFLLLSYGFSTMPKRKRSNLYRVCKKNRMQGKIRRTKTRESEFGITPKVAAEDNLKTWFVGDMKKICMKCGSKISRGVEGKGCIRKFWV